MKSGDRFRCNERASAQVVLGILRRTVKRFTEARASQAAASMSYYGLFSLFPLLLALVSAGSFFLQGDQVYEQTIGLVGSAIPVSGELIEQNLQQVLKSRGTVGVLSLAGLLWSALGAFTTLARNINHAWTEAEQRGFLKRRLVALGMIGVLAALLFLSLLSTAALELLPRLHVPPWDTLSIYETPLWSALSSVVPVWFGFLMFLAIYRWVPNTDVPWPAALWGALFAALAWEAAKRGFAWYLGSGLVKYRLVYGSLGAVVALMFWVYLSAWIALFGAHLSAAVAESREHG